jgi:hypothetical protein
LEDCRELLVEVKKEVEEEKEEELLLRVREEVVRARHPVQHPVVVVWHWHKPELGRALVRICKHMAKDIVKHKFVNDLQI